MRLLKRAKILLLVKPVYPPTWWPTRNDGWVTVKPDGVGFTAGRDPDYAMPRRHVRRTMHDMHFELDDLAPLQWRQETP